MSTNVRRLQLILPLLLGATVLLSAAGPAPASARSTPPPAVATDRLVVTLAPEADAGAQRLEGATQVASLLSPDAGAGLTYVRPLEGGAHVFALDGVRPAEEVAAIMDGLAANPAVVGVEPDIIVFPMREPSDPLYNMLWHFKPVVSGNYGANLPAAWNVTTGSPAIVTAIIDTGGRLGHEDLTGRTPAGNPGYDMISDPYKSNDGNGRDGDPSDPGDYVLPSEATAACPQDSSSWHGSHVAGTIGARANNGKGVAGIVWDGPLLHIRTLGKCGGYLSDISDGVRWAAGINVGGLPANPNPARVLNLSLGGGGACPSFMQSAINAAENAGAVVVVAAGNQGSDAAFSTPANCQNVITVAATGQNGTRASYSNYGSVVEIAAPGGDNRAPDGANTMVYSTVDSGFYGPAGDSYAFYQGTSMATPHVAGIAALMLAANPGLAPADVLSIMQSTVTPFPPGSGCAGICGAGIINAGAAVEEAARRVRTSSFGRSATTATEGATISIPVTLSIAGAQPVAVPFTIGGTAGPDDTNLFAGSVTLPAGVKSVNLSVTLVDDTVAEQSETLVITLGTGTRSRPGAGLTHTVTIVDNDARAGLGLTPRSLAFGDQRVGTAGVAKTVTISSTGDLSLNVSGLSFSGGFVRAGGTCPSNPPFALAVGASCTVGVAFSPTRAVSHNGAMTIVSNAGPAQTVTLGGRGVTPALGFGPTIIGFNGQDVSTTSAAQTIILTNPGTAPLNVSTITASGDYQLGAEPCAASLPTTLAPGASCAVEVTFTPQADGLREGALTVASDVVGGPYSVALTGAGLVPQNNAGAAPATPVAPADTVAAAGFGLRNIVVGGTLYTVTLSFDVVRDGPLDAAANVGYRVVADRETANADLAVADSVASFAAGAGVRRVTLTLDRLAIYGATNLVVSLDNPGGGATPALSSSIAVPADLTRLLLPIVVR